MNELDIRIILLILILNSCLAVLFFIIGIFKQKGKRATTFLAAWFILTAPLIGILYLLVSQIMYYFRKSREADKSDISFFQDREEIVIPPDVNVELNFVPIEDAMAVSDKRSLRKLLLDSMAKSEKQTISSLFPAINSDDSESSHYVASLITDTLSTAKTSIQKYMEKLKKNPENVELNLEVFNYIHEVLSIKIMSRLEEQTFISILGEVTNTLYEKNLWYLTGEHYLKIIDLYIGIEDYDNAYKWMMRANRYRGDTLETYKANLHLYFAQKNSAAFLDTLNRLKKSDIIVDEEVLNLFRLYH